VAKKQRAGNSYKSQYASYKASSKQAVNKKRKLKAHLKKHPEDNCAKSALSKPISYTRNRKSNGHICKVEKLHAEILWNRKGHLPLSLGEQMKYDTR
jgi:hypothetical protein